MPLSRKQQWLMLSGLAGVVASQAADRLLSTGYRAVARRDPPDDLHYSDVNWTTAVLWTAGVGALIAVTELFARHGAAVAWRKTRGHVRRSDGGAPSTGRSPTRFADAR